MLWPSSPLGGLLFLSRLLWSLFRPWEIEIIHIIFQVRQRFPSLRFTLGGPRSSTVCKKRCHHKTSHFTHRWGLIRRPLPQEALLGQTRCGAPQSGSTSAESPHCQRRLPVSSCLCSYKLESQVLDPNPRRYNLYQTNKIYIKIKSVMSLVFVWVINFYIFELPKSIYLVLHKLLYYFEI